MTLFKKITIVLFFTITLFLLSKKSFSALKINEIYPAPLAGGEEWVELYNNSEQTINLSSYLLVDENNKKIIFSTSSALPFSFIIATSSGVLNNKGPETVYLKDNFENILDIASYSSSISFDANKSFIRCLDGGDEWFITNSITKGQSNNSVCLMLTPTPTLSPAMTEVFSPTPTVNFNLTQTPTPVFTSYENIYLSEVMVNPVSGEKEWVEIYNDNDFQVELNNWFIDDLENAGSTPKSFTLVIDKKSYGVVELSVAIFNNNGDQVRLLDFNKKERDSFEYLSSERGKSYGRTSFSSDEWCQQEPSQGIKNNPCLTQPTITTTITVFNSPSSGLSSSSLNKNSNNSFSISKPNNYSKKRTYKSYQPKLLSLNEQKNSFVGEILGEETRRESKKNDLLFLPLFQSLATSFLLLRKILKSVKVVNYD